MMYFVTATDTDSGKTLFSTILATKLKAKYWKPIQAGSPSDTSEVSNYIGKQNCLKERFSLNAAMSPHAAARLDGIQINLSDFSLPEINEPLVIEGAGGVLVPINDKNTVADLIEQLNIPIIIVSNTYLGSINHTMLTIQECKRRDLQIAGLVFNGEENEETEKFILANSGLKCLLKIPRLDKIDKKIINELAQELTL